MMSQAMMLLLLSLHWTFVQHQHPILSVLCEVCACECVSVCVWMVRVRAREYACRVVHEYEEVQNKQAWLTVIPPSSQLIITECSPFMSPSRLWFVIGWPLEIASLSSTLMESLLESMQMKKCATRTKQQLLAGRQSFPWVFWYEMRPTNSLLEVSWEGMTTN